MDAFFPDFCYDSRVWHVMSCPQGARWTASGDVDNLIEWVVVTPIVHCTGDLYSVVIDNAFIGSNLQLNIFADISRKLLKMKKYDF